MLVKITDNLFINPKRVIAVYYDSGMVTVVIGRSGNNDIKITPRTVQEAMEILEIITETINGVTK